MTKNRMKKILLGVIVFIAYICLIQLSSNAAGFSVSVDSKSITTGKTTTFKLNSQDCLGKFLITTDNSGVVSIEGDTTPWFDGSRNT